MLLKKTPNYKAMQIKFYDYSVLFTNDLLHNPNTTYRTPHEEFHSSSQLVDKNIYHIQAYSYFLFPK